MEFFVVQGLDEKAAMFGQHGECVACLEQNINKLHHCEDLP